MGLLASDILERTKSEYLGAKNEAWDTIDTALTDTTGKAVSLAGRVSVPNDSVLEAYDSSMELMLNKVTSTSNDLTLQERGYLETTAATHLVDTRFILDPVWPRSVLFNALKSTVGSLYGYGLYGKAYTGALTYSDVAPVALPAGARGVVSMLMAVGTQWIPVVEGSDFRVLHGYGPLVTSPPALQFLCGGLSGATLKVTYKKDFTAPTLLSDDLGTVSLIPDTLQPHLAMAVAAYILQGRDIPLLNNERIKEALANAGIQPGTRSGVASRLLSTFALVHVAAERRRQLESAPTRITLEGY